MTTSATASSRVKSLITAIPPAPSARALQHFTSLLELETDCWDVHAAITEGHADFVLLDVRSPSHYAAGHVPGSSNLPHAKIVQGMLRDYAMDTVFVVYCAGPHCNGAYRAAIRLAELGRPVKVMIGGISGWREEGFELTR